MSTAERLDQLEERLAALTTLLRMNFSTDELHHLAELLADELMRDGVDVRSGEDLLDP